MKSSVDNERPSMTWYVGTQKNREKKGLNSEVAGIPFRNTIFYVNKWKWNLEKNVIIYITFLETDMLSQIWLSLVCWLLHCCSSQWSWVLSRGSKDKGKEVNHFSKMWFLIKIVDFCVIRLKFVLNSDFSIKFFMYVTYI